MPNSQIELSVNKLDIIFDFLFSSVFLISAIHLTKHVLPVLFEPYMAAVFNILKLFSL